MAARARGALNALALPSNLVRALIRGASSPAIIIHDGRFKAMPPSLVVPLCCYQSRDRLAKPADLSIVTLHNRPYKTLFEQSLDYVGVNDYVVLHPAPGQRWRNTLKITCLLDYVRSGACRSEYLLYFDADDAVLRGSPAVAIDALKAADCEMLVSSTPHGRYHGMPDVKLKTSALAPPDIGAKQRAPIHLNAGVFISRTAFLLEYLDDAKRYVSDDDMPIKALHQTSDDDLLRLLPDFPLGVGSDQTIMRYLFFRYYPRIKIDYEQKLAIR